MAHLLLVKGSVSIVIELLKDRQKLGVESPADPEIFVTRTGRSGGVSDQIGRLQTAARDAFQGLWQIRQGDNRVPILVVHGDDVFRLLPPHLPANQSIYGYFHQGSDGERVSLNTVEKLANRCHAEWLEVCGDAPCAIMGHSFGGLVAWHVARLRQQAGLPVDLLAMIDTLHPVTERRVRTSGWRGTPLAWDRARTELCRLITLIRAELRFRLRRSIPIEKRKRYILVNYERAALRYHPPVLDTRVLYFSATENPCSSHNLIESSNQDCWRQITRGRFDVSPVPGTHCSIVRSASEFEVIGRALAGRVAELRGQLGIGDVLCL